MDPKDDPIGNLLAPKRQEPDAELDEFARLVIGAAIEVHRHLGPGLLEDVYEEALCMEFELRKIPFMRQERVGITYKGRAVGKGRLDLLVGGRLIVELKSVERLAPIHSAQIISLSENDKSNAWPFDQFQRACFEGRNKASRLVLI